VKFFKFKVALLCILVILMPLFAVGCLEDMEAVFDLVNQIISEQVDPAAEPGPAAAGDSNNFEDSADTAEEVTFEPMSAEDGWVDFGTFVKLVESARWKGISPGCYDGESLTTYDYLGTETIDGITADKIEGSFTVNGGDRTAWTMWVDHGGNVVKAEANGSEMEPDTYGFFSMSAVPILVPFTLPDPEFNSEFKRSLAGENVPGWELQSFERNPGNIGGKAAYICEASFIHPAWDSQVASFTHGDFGSFKLLLEIYQAYSSSSTKTESLTFR